MKKRRVDIGSLVNKQIGSWRKGEEISRIEANGKKLVNKEMSCWKDWRMRKLKDWAEGLRDLSKWKSWGNEEGQKLGNRGERKETCGTEWLKSKTRRYIEKLKNETLRKQNRWKNGKRASNYKNGKTATGSSLGNLRLSIYSILGSPCRIYISISDLLTYQSAPFRGR